MNVVFVSIAFPPKNDPEALQAGRYFAALRDRPNLHLDVVTSASPTLWMPDDPSLVVDGWRQLVEIPIFEPRFLSTALLKFFPQWTRLPDTRMTFYLQWRRAARALRSRPDLIYSRCYPLSSNFMARKLAAHFRVPWVMHMSDPWIAPGFPTYQGFAKAFNERQERACVAAATAVTYSSYRIRDLYRKRYPDLAHRFHDAPNVYDASLNTPPVRTTGERLRMVYTGSLDSNRSLKYFYTAFEILARTAPRVLDALEVVVAGQLDASNRRLLARKEFSFVRYEGIVSYERSRALQRSADRLLVIDNRLSAEDAIYFPSKLLDYMTTGAPILAITTEQSMTREVLGNAGLCFDHEDAAGLANAIGLAVREFRPGATVRATATPDSRFSPAANAERLHRLFAEVCGRDVRSEVS